MILNAICVHFKFGMIVHVLATGQYPPKVLEAIDRNNEKEGIVINRLQQLSEAEGESIKGNHASSQTRRVIKERKTLIADGKQQ